MPPFFSSSKWHRPILPPDPLPALHLVALKTKMDTECLDKHYCTSSYQQCDSEREVY